MKLSMHFKSFSVQTEICFPHISKQKYIRQRQLSNAFFPEINVKQRDLSTPWDMKKNNARKKEEFNVEMFYTKKRDLFQWKEISVSLASSSRDFGTGICITFLSNLSR